jgi:hypothetical protein
MGAEGVIGIVEAPGGGAAGVELPKNVSPDGVLTISSP